MKYGLLLLLLSLPLTSYAQSNEQIMNEMEDDSTLGGDIFSDFNEDLEASEVLEDERYYRYGRFFSVNLGVGVTTYTGNRGTAYDDNPPTYHLSTNYFLDFQNVVGLGIEYSKHTMILDTATLILRDANVGAVETSMLRAFFQYKYYVDTTDLGTAFTYSSPHFIGRFEYWYQNNKFIDQPSLPNQKGGGIGTAFGLGLEFPVEIKKSYIGVEFLYHVVNFFDKYTQDFRQVPADVDQADNSRIDSTYGYEDLTGNVISAMVSYNFTW
ncbi:MAG: hypothetical protein ACOVP4_08180 [Bacteriovoracaceae bacterium]|jgi:hypothetical protein